MDVLKTLEEKLAHLVELAKALKMDKLVLEEENAQLKMQISILEKMLSGEEKSIQELKQEKELAKLAVDDLIKSIDELVQSQSSN